jgi:hypothetical protein
MVTVVTPPGGYELSYIYGMTIDSGGNLYVSDYGWSVVWEIAPSGSAKVVAGTIGVQGSGDGVVGTGELGGPLGVAVDTVGNVYIADSLNDTIRMVTKSTG